MRLFHTIIAAIAALSVRAAVPSFYGLAVDPDRPEGWKESYLVATSPESFVMRQPDGVLRTFRRGEQDRRTLVGEYPWVGEVSGGQALIITDEAFKGGRTGFMFVGGKLKKVLLNDREVNVPAVQSERDAQPVGCVWPDVSRQAVADATAKYRMKWTDGRLRLWYENPNYAGGLLAELAVLLLAATLAFGGWRKAVVGVLFVIAAAGVVLTQSRSGLLGLMAGVACLGMVRLRSLFRWRVVLPALGVLVAVVAVAWVAGVGERLTVGLFNENFSETSRIPIWRTAPAMMASAPLGWGIGDSGVAYMNWFQPLDRFHSVLGLISTHLTWLVEFGWPLRVAYAGFWGVLLAVLLVDAFRTKSAGALGVWTTFFVAAVFNSIGKSWTLWVLPVAVLGYWMTAARKRPLRPCLIAAVTGFALAGLLVAALAVAGQRMRTREGEVLVSFDGSRLTVNGEQASIWVVDDGYVLDGGYYGLLGKSVRRWYARRTDAPSLGIVRDIADVPDDARRVVLAGKTGEQFIAGGDTFLAAHPQLKELVFVSPPFGWWTLPSAVTAKYDVSWYVGEYAARMAGDPPSETPDWVRVVPGCALYLPNWLKYTLR